MGLYVEEQRPPKSQHGIALNPDAAIFEADMQPNRTNSATKAQRLLIQPNVVLCGEISRVFVISKLHYYCFDCDTHRH